MTNLTRYILLIALSSVAVTRSTASIWTSYWSSSPSTAYSGSPYFIEAKAHFINWYGYDDDGNDGTVDLYRNNNYVTGNYDWYVVTAGAWFTDNGSQTVSYQAEIYDYYGNYDWLYHEVEIVATGTPVASVSVDGYSSGATITRPRGGSVTITVRYTATDSDGNLSGIRPQIWMPSGELDNNNGAFVSQGGTSGEVVRTVTLNANGSWRFWSDAQDVPLAASGTYVDSGSWNAGFLITVNEESGPPPVATVTVDGYASGENVIWYYGAPVPTITVRYKATDPDGNLTGIRPQVWTFWEEGWYDNNGEWQSYMDQVYDDNGGQYVGQSGENGEVVRTVTLDHETTWYFWSDAIDSVGQSVTSGSWSNGYQLTVVRQVSYPSISVKYLDVNGTPLSPQSDGLIYIQTGTQLRVRLTGTAPGNNVGRLYWRVQKPGNAQGESPGPEWSWGGWGWGGEMPVAGNTTWTSELMTLGEAGVWQFWHHAQIAGAGPCPPDGNSNGWATVAAPNIKVVDPLLDSDGDGVPDAIEIMVGLNPADPQDIPVANISEYKYDANHQLKEGPGRNYKYDKEGNHEHP